MVQVLGDEINSVFGPESSAGTKEKDAEHKRLKTILNPFWAQYDEVWCLRRQIRASATVSIDVMSHICAF